MLDHYALEPVGLKDELIPKRFEERLDPIFRQVTDPPLFHLRFEYSSIPMVWKQVWKIGDPV